MSGTETRSFALESAAIMGKRKMRVGDRLTFKAATRSHYRKATRPIRGFTPQGRPMVAYHGWSDFVVQPHEIISCEPAE